MRRLSLLVTRSAALPAILSLCSELGVTRFVKTSLGDSIPIIHVESGEADMTVLAMMHACGDFLSDGPLALSTTSGAFFACERGGSWDDMGALDRDGHLVQGRRATRRARKLTVHF